MRKTLLLLASAAMLLVGCAKEQIAPNAAEEGKQTVSFTVGVESAATKAAADGDGAAASINHWIMQVLDSDDKVYNYQEKDGGVGVKTQTFDVPLIKGQTYQVLFWADTKGKYVVTDLRNVKRADAVALTANCDDLDAFSAVVENFSTTVATSQPITLKRPFAQLNVVFTDLKKLFETMGSDAEYTKFKPTTFVAKAKVPTTFNVLTQQAGSPAATALEMKAATNYKDNYAAHGEKATLYMDYILASAASKDIVDIDFSFVSKGVTIAHNFASIPFQRNYRTNIIGELMSAGAEWNVVVDKNWDGEYDYPPFEVGTIAAANAALAAGETNISISDPSDYATVNLDIPAAANGKDLIIAVADNVDLELKVDASASSPKTISLSAGVAKSLNINAPETHVEVNTGSYTTVTAITSATTLVVGKEVTIGTLTINGGNAAIYGLVNTINRQASTVVDFYVSTAAGLRSVAEKISAAPGNKDFYGKVYLTADIDLNNEEWTPIAAFQKPLYIDGQGYTIKNLKVTESTIDYIGFIGTACGLTVKDLNFDTVTLSYPSTVGENARGGVIAGQVYGASIENCSVKNVDITACQKVGGLIGYIEGDTNVPHTIKNCSVEKVSIKSNDPAKILQHGAGGFIGHISLNQNPCILISGCSVMDVTIANYRTAPYTSSELQRVPHVFIGNVCNTYTGEEVPDINSHSIVLSNNTISGTNNTILPTCIYSSEYFGWAGNAEESPAWKGGIYIDGQAWTPSYVTRNVTKGLGYGSLADAVTAAEEGDEIVILKAGTYTVPNIPKNITITGEGDVNENGVVFNCVGSGSIASISNGATFKNVTMNFGQSSYHGFQHAGHIVMKGCVLNGLFFSYGEMTFNGCIFNQEKAEYHMWDYGTNLTYKDCTFNGHGKYINVYNEGTADPAWTLNVSGCKFVNLADNANKAPLNIKETSGATLLAYDVTIGEGNTLVGNFPAASISTSLVVGNGLWQVDDRYTANPSASKIIVREKGRIVYEKGALLALSTPEQLMAFAAAVNGGNSFAGKTVYLDADVDMSGINWIPAGSVTSYPSITFEGTFDGQNHIISNLKAADNTQNHATAGLFGSLMGTVKNVTLKDVSISSTHYAGAIMGYSSSSSVVIDNCRVIGGTIISTPELIGTEYDNGDKAGGIVGYAGDAPCTISNCSVEGVEVRAYRDLGGIAGASSATISGCTVKNSSIIQDNTNAYKTSIDTYHEILGRDLGATLTGNTFENVTVKSEN